MIFMLLNFIFKINLWVFLRLFLKVLLGKILNIYVNFYDSNL